MNIVITQNSEVKRKKERKKDKLNVLQRKV